jgi:hypothetical protein
MEELIKPIEAIHEFAEIFGPDHKVHYRRPVGDPMVAEAIRTPGYYVEIRKVKPLFIPLKREWFDAFASGSKDTEFRPFIPRWGSSVCFIGRPVILSLGYGKQKRLSGIVAGWKPVGPDAHPAIRWVYPTGDHFVAIKIKVAALRARERG